ncbi:MAG: molybdenum cofactor guanylyltransferase [Verrucomicrobiota bacterium]|jgi:molybdopterin-guanine dinucleotide biosynthesis protein A
MKFSAVLLAGGESRRMGRDKATLLFSGAPLWKRQIELLRQLEPAEIFISGRTDPVWRPANVDFVADVPPSRGPLSGLAASLRRIQTDHLLTMAIDMPLMTAAWLGGMCDRIEPGHGLLPMIGNRAEPLAAIYPVEVAADCDKALAGKDFSLQSVVRQLVAAGTLRIVEVPEDGQELYRNINIPADLSD